MNYLLFTKNKGTMKKLKRLKFKKESIMELDRQSMQQLMGGDFTLAFITCTAVTSAYPICNGNGDNNDDYDNNQGNGSRDYCGTLNNCGTGMVYCVSYDCFYNTQPCH